VIVERERPRVAKQGPEKEAVDLTAVAEKPAAVAVTPRRNLEYFRKLVKEIQEDLAISDLLSGWIEKVDGTESVGFIINMDDGEEAEQTVPPVITGAQKQAIDPAQENFIALRSMHDWLDDVRYEFMYNPPPENKKNDYKEWLEEWAKIMFDFAKIEKKHVIYVQELLNRKPFQALRTGKEAIIDIGENLAKKKLAIWVVKKEKLRVYWKSLDEWASVIYDWAYKNAKTEPLFVYDLKEEHESFSDLPEDEFPEIFKILEKQKKGKMVKSSDKKLAFVFDLTK
jgi:predicted CopG family antitoxin